MRKAYLVFLFIGVLHLLNIPLFHDFTTAVIPGWHVTIMSPYMIGGLFVGLWIFLLAGAYWILTKRIQEINKGMFLVHVLLTIPLIVFYMVIDRVLIYTIIHKDDSLFDLAFYVSAALFVIGQMLFIRYFVVSLVTRIEKG